MTVAAHIQELVTLLRGDRPNRPLILLGAGASYRSGIPLAAEAVRRVAKQSYARRVLGSDPRFRNPKPSDWMPFLARQPWFITDPDRLAENFPLAVKHMLTPREFRREFFLEMVKPLNGVNDGYRHLAELMMRGLCSTVLTTNFDHLLVDALLERRPHIHHITEVNRTPGDLAQFDIYARFQVVYLHGAVEYYTDKNLEEETESLDGSLVAKLRPLLDDSPLIVIGYRGAESSVMRDLLEAGISSSFRYRHGVYWCTRQGAQLHPKVSAFAAQIGSNFKHLEVEGFDQLLEALNNELKEEYRYQREAASYSLPSGHAADERPLSDVTFNDLDHDLILSTLIDYTTRLGRPSVSRENYTTLLFEQGLLVEVDGRIHPTVACYLLFGKNVPSRLPHACVAVTANDKQRRLFDGNLITQFRNLVEYLRDEKINPVLRIKSSRSSTQRPAYPDRALVEMIVNMLVHRDYGVSDFARIDVTPGQSLSFSNPGGLPDKIHRNVEINDEGQFQPVRSLTELRNPSLADIFYGIGPMDKAGSGLSDVKELMLQDGGDTSYAIGPDNRWFHATLIQPRQSAPGRSAVAVPVSPMGEYVTNHLPFRVLPEHIYLLPLRPGTDRGAPLFYSDESNRELPIFIKQRTRLLTFADLRQYADFAERRGYLERLEVIPMQQFLEDKDNRNLFVWLVRKHFEFYLHRFGEQGLVIDGRKKSRAYFRLVKGSGNTVIYDSAKRRGIRREVVKQRGSDRKHWHENEGISYSIVQFDGAWALRIKPFYMFTGKDGVKPLSAHLQTRRATRRMKYDRNRNVDDDLTFWARYLSCGQTAINIGNVGIDNLVLDSSFCSVEVHEFGLEGSADGNAHRVPA